MFQQAGKAVSVSQSSSRKSERMDYIPQPDSTVSSTDEALELCRFLSESHGNTRHHSAPRALCSMHKSLLRFVSSSVTPRISVNGGVPTTELYWGAAVDSCYFFMLPRSGIDLALLLAWSFRTSRRGWCPQLYGCSTGKAATSYFIW